MSPRSLLFSSNEETSRKLAEALYGLELDVEYCPEIFIAVEKLTTRVYDVVVVDWDEGLEASFLLKTARELKSHSAALTLAVAKESDAAAALQVGAHLVLEKPVDPDKAKYALLTSDVFLQHMRNWLPRLQIANSESRAQSSGPLSHTPRMQTLEEASTAPVSSLRKASGRLGNGRILSIAERGAGDLFSGWPYVGGPIRKSQPRSRAPILTAATLMVLVCMVYIFSQPLHGERVVSSVAHAYSGTLAKAGSWFQNDDDEGTSEELLAQNHEPKAIGSPMRIRVTPVPDPYAAVQRAPQATPVQAKPEPPLVSKAQAPVIPESLKAPILTQVDHKVDARPAAPSLLASLEPVNLPEETSQKLLLERVQPSYPAQAMQVGMQGAVVLQAWIGRDGKVQDLKLIRGPFLLGQAAYQAVKQWRYKPYRLNGQVVEAQTLVTVDFKLP